MPRLADKAALIMGATGGIGATCAEMFAAEGARVVVTGRRATEGEAVAQRIVDGGGDAAFIRCDVTDEASVERTVREAAERMGRLDVLVNNAGGSGNADGPVTTASLDEFWNKMRVDHFGAFLGCRFGITEMLRSGGGAVINMVSMAGFGNNTGGRAAYASAKAAVMNLTRTAAHAFVRQNVRVNGIAPAAAGTERIRAMLGRPEAKSALDGQPLGLIDTRDIGHAAIFLASDESRMITGHILPVHAGAFGD